MYIRLKDLRQTLGKYQSDFSSVMKVTQSVISRMETKDYTEIAPLQYKYLCEEYGKDIVDQFCSEKLYVSIVGNTNTGSGTQTNGMVTSCSNGGSMEKVAESLARIMEKQTEQTDKLLELITKLSDKL